MIAAKLIYGGEQGKKEEEKLFLQPPAQTAGLKQKKSKIVFWNSTRSAFITYLFFLKGKTVAGKENK